MAVIGVLLAALAAGLLLYLLLAAVTRPANFPPGPPPMPIWGNYLQMLAFNYKYPYKVLDLLTWLYKSKVIGFYFGDMLAIAACDYASVKEALDNPHLQGRILNISLKHRMFNKDLGTMATALVRAVPGIGYLRRDQLIYELKIRGMSADGSVPELAARLRTATQIPVTLSPTLFSDHGIIFTEGPHWLEQKRFSLRYMRDFGFGRRSDKLEAEIAAELQDLVELIRGGREDQAVVRASSGARSVLLPDALWPGFINGLLPVYCGARLPRCADEAARELGSAAQKFQKSSDATGGFLTLHPWLAWMSPGLSGYRDHTEGSDKMRLFLEKYIEEHKKTYSDDYMRDFIDRYLQEIREREKTGEPTAFTAQQLSLILLDFFFPAASALSATLSWALVYMVHHPQECARVQREIDSVVGRGRLPTLDDRPNLPYTEATLREVMRIRTLTPISVPHKAMEDTTLQGYSVPKGTIVLTCLYNMHMDGDLWGDPNVFRPERFLDSDGKLSKKDFTLPFGAGKRLCAGETFARQNLFLTFSALMQNFSLKSDGVPLPNDSVPGILETAPTFWAQFVPR